MPVPLALAVPVAAAAAAYINGRTDLANDLKFLTSLSRVNRLARTLDKQDRVNIFYRLEENAQNKQLAGHTFLIYQGRKWTFRETYDIVLKYATWLKANHGIAPKDVVALDYMNCPKFLFIIFALWSLGATPALINYNLTSKALVHCLRTSSARLIFVDDEVKSNFTEEVMADLTASDFRGPGNGPAEVRVHDLAMENEVEKVSKPIREPDSARSGAGINQGDRCSALIYTSGTTGLPKAAIVSWFKHYAPAMLMGDVIGLNKDDIFYTCMPVYHSTAFCLCVTPCLIRGITCSLGHKFSNKTFWPDVRESKATVISYVGETCRYLLAAPAQVDPKTGANLDKVNDVRLAYGNGMRPDVWQRFKDRFGIQTIAEFYGATEAPAASINVSNNDFSRGAIGKRGSLLSLLTSGLSKIVELDWELEEPKRDPKNNNFCTMAKPDEPGELLFSLDPAEIEDKFQGYYGNSKASNSKIMRDVFKKGDAWFRTGDAIRLNSDGQMYFCDRIGDTFRWRSENVSTNEVSEVLGKHPAITEANVYGVEVPRHDGRCGCAAITTNGTINDEMLRSLAKQARSNLPKYAVPIFLRVVKKMQSTGNNKQQKHGLRTEGVNPTKVSDRLLWLKGDTYVDFAQEDFKQIEEGQVKL